MKQLAKAFSVIGIGVMSFGCGANDPAEADVAVAQSGLSGNIIRPGSIVVPAYFGNDADYTEISGPPNSTLPEIAVLNAGCDYTGQMDSQGNCLVGGGPGPSRDTYIHDKMIFLRSHGVKVFAYVYTGGLTDAGAAPDGTHPATHYRSTQDIYLDMVFWVNNYLDNSNHYTMFNGFFFDAADRQNTTGVGPAAYLAHWAGQYASFSGTAVGETGQSTPGRAIFNWGATSMNQSLMQSYFDCLLLKNTNSWNYFVLEETYKATFMISTMPAWAQYRYDPTHFMTIIHDSSPNDGTDVNAIVSRAVTSWDSAYVYVTDQTEPNPYAVAPSVPVWNAEVSQQSGHNSVYNFGTAPDQLNACNYADSNSTPAFP